MKENEISLKAAAFINITARYTNIILQIIANAILARLLTANDYGIIAIILVFTSFFVLLSDMGLGAGVIQNKQLKSDDIDNIYSMTIYAGIALMGIFILLSYPISWFYNNDVFIPVGSLLSISVLFSTINIIPNAILMKQKRFKLAGIRTIVISVLSYVVAIILAYYGYKYYALVVQSLVLSSVTYLLNIWSTKLKFKLKFKFSSVKKILGFSAYDFGFNIINYFARNTDSLLTGKFMSSAALGFYSRAYNLMLYPVMNLTHVISPILHPILSDHQDNKEYIFDKYLKVYKLLSLMGIFISVFCYFSAHELINIIYGPNWESTVPCMAALGVSIWFQMTSSSCGSIYRSLGMTSLMFKSVTRFVPIQLVMIFIGVLSKDIMTLSWCVSISFIIKYFIEYYYLVGKGFNKSVIGFLQKNTPEVFIVLLMCVVMLLIKNIPENNVFASLGYKFFACLVTFIVGLVMTKQLKFLMPMVPNRYRNKYANFRLRKSQKNYL
ncbi:lipopolysaccharide biosynthesis protein [Paenibacillus protaetiae]|uniref:Lipopolysaccharide biosynthesis protein n=1 Tax=Paenibacillus protaetiae TaxID=2509456 RepID=A0A4P6EUU7_9BACL|nr:lipopolysaccharide biosynthesis protein [Paenibacillus protaetiae]QAY66762.1 lipopolysaccharide biosynthesis protein [Paenibacillus protaetiae]